MIAEKAAQRNRVECDGLETVTTIDGAPYILGRDPEHGWYVIIDGKSLRLIHGRVAAGIYRRAVEAAMLAQEARRRWENGFEQWLTGCELYRSGAPEELCATPGQLRGYRDERDYCRNIDRYAAIAESSEYLHGYEPCLLAS